MGWGARPHIDGSRDGTVGRSGGWAFRISGELILVGHSMVSLSVGRSVVVMVVVIGDGHMVVVVVVGGWVGGRARVDSRFELLLACGSRRRGRHVGADEVSRHPRRGGVGMRRRAATLLRPPENSGTAGTARFLSEHWEWDNCKRTTAPTDIKPQITWPAETQKQATGIKIMLRSSHHLQDHLVSSLWHGEVNENTVW